MSDVRYYVLFANYEQGLKLHGILDGAGVQNRIAPAPHCIQGELSCGMSLLIEKEHIDEAKAVIGLPGRSITILSRLRGR